MGLQSPFHYTDRELKHLFWGINVYNDYCVGCHSNRDWDGDCNKCPAGYFIKGCKDYWKRVPGWMSDDDWRQKVGLPKMNRWQKKYYDLCMKISKEIDEIVSAPLDDNLIIDEEKIIRKFEYYYCQLTYYNVRKFKTLFSDR